MDQGKDQGLVSSHVGIAAVQSAVPTLGVEDEGSVSACQDGSGCAPGTGHQLGYKDKDRGPRSLVTWDTLSAVGGGAASAGGLHDVCTYSTGCGLSPGLARRVETGRALDGSSLPGSRDAELSRPPA